MLVIVIRDEACLPKRLKHTVISIKCVHCTDIGEKYAYCVQRVKKKNVENIACVVLKLTFNARFSRVVLLLKFVNADVNDNVVGAAA